MDHDVLAVRERVKIMNIVPRDQVNGCCGVRTYVCVC